MLTVAQLILRSLTLLPLSAFFGNSGLSRIQSANLFSWLQCTNPMVQIICPPASREIDILDYSLINLLQYTTPIFYSLFFPNSQQIVYDRPPSMWVCVDSGGIVRVNKDNLPQLAGQREEICWSDGCCWHIWSWFLFVVLLWRVEKGRITSSLEVGEAISRQPWCRDGLQRSQWSCFSICMRGSLTTSVSRFDKYPWATMLKYVLIDVGSQGSRTNLSLTYANHWIVSNRFRHQSYKSQLISSLWLGEISHDDYEDIVN